MEKVIQIINDNAVATGNLCGLSLVQIMKRANLPSSDAKQILNQIHADKKIRIREGIHGKLVFAL